MIKKSILLIFFFTLATHFTLIAQKKNLNSKTENSIHHYFSTANRYYKNQHYFSALEIYQKLLREFSPIDQVQMADLFYNQGNTYYKLYEAGHYTNHFLAQAVWSYEKAILLQPGHTDATYNVKVIKNQIDIQNRLEPSRLEQVHFYWIKKNNLLFHFLGIIFITILLGIYSYRSFKVFRRKKWLKLILVGSIGYFLILGMMLLLNFLFAPQENQAIIASDLEMKAEPSFLIDNKTVSAIREGSRVKVIRYSLDQKWAEVEKANLRGWVEEQELLLLQEEK